ncbi:MAG: DUF2551 domain-containing protein [Methanomicrobiales archaeon]|nr:DUF2551 domain-containing protein [Methanomicrobiales archaeon]MDI6876544.1 DUF2551 domain-containing protein [Methanomicrobiales archaeon]
MKFPSDIRKDIEARLIGYLSRDRTGIRRELLGLFLRIKALTIPQIYNALKNRFSISYHQVASMVGIIASKLGILRLTRNAEGTNTLYELKEQYVDMVRRIVSSA